MDCHQDVCTLVIVALLISLKSNIETLVGQLSFRWMKMFGVIDPTLSPGFLNQRRSRFRRINDLYMLRDIEEKRYRVSWMFIQQVKNLVVHGSDAGWRGLGLGLLVGVLGSGLPGGPLAGVLNDPLDGVEVLVAREDLHDGGDGGHDDRRLLPGDKETSKVILVDDGAEEVPLPHQGKANLLHLKEGNNRGTLLKNLHYLHVGLHLELVPVDPKVTADGLDLGRGIGNCIKRRVVVTASEPGNCYVSNDFRIREASELPSEYRCARMSRHATAGDDHGGIDREVEHLLGEVGQDLKGRLPLLSVALGESPSRDCQTPHGVVAGDLLQPLRHKVLQFLVGLGKRGLGLLQGGLGLLDGTEPFLVGLVGGHGAAMEAYDDKGITVFCVQTTIYRQGGGICLFLVIIQFRLYFSMSVQNRRP